MELVEPVLKNIYESNTYRKDLSWPHFNDEPGSREAASEVPTVLHIGFCSLSSLAIPNSNLGHKPRNDDSISYMGVW